MRHNIVGEAVEDYAAGEIVAGVGKVVSFPGMAGHLRCILFVHSFADLFPGVSLRRDPLGPPQQ